MNPKCSTCDNRPSQFYRAIIKATGIQIRLCRTCAKAVQEGHVKTIELIDTHTTPSNANPFASVSPVEMTSMNSERNVQSGKVGPPPLTVENTQTNNISQEKNIIILPPPVGKPNTLPSPADALLPRVHFIECTSVVKDVFTHQELEFPHDAANVEIIFGEWRQKITFTIQQDKPGLAASEFTNVLNRIMDLVSRKLGRQVIFNEFKVVNMHINYDYIGLRLEGIKAVTLFEVEHWLSRLYTKQESIRSEGVLTGGEVRLDQAYALLMRSHTDRELLKKTTELLEDARAKLQVLESKVNIIDTRLSLSLRYKFLRFLGRKER